MNVNEKRRRAIIYGGLFGIICLAITFVVLSVFSKDKVQLSSDVSEANTTRVEGAVASSNASEEYNQMLKKHDDNEANKALETGESYFSIPTSQKPVEVPKAPAPTPTPAPEPTVVKNEEVKAPVQPRITFTQDELKRMTEAIALLDEQLGAQIGQGNIAYIAEIPTEASEQNTQTENTNLTPQENTFKTGDLLYAIVDTAINSDVNSVVMATIVSGTHKKAKLIGSFARFDKRLVIQFNRAVLLDGTETPIEAYAIDPKTTEASVASRVNTRFFSRWGGLIAASFLEGFGEATQMSGAESVDNVFGESTGSMVFSNYSVADQAWIAAGKVGEKVGEIFTQNFNRPPTVYLDMGSAIGILIINTGK